LGDFPGGEDGMARVRLASCRVLLRLMLASRAPPQTLSEQDAARRLSPMRAWCSHCRAGVDDKRLQHVREHGALIGGCNVLPSETPAAPVPAVWRPQDGPVPDGMDITHSSCWRSAAARRFPRQHNASDSLSPSLRRRHNGALRGSHCT
jgi:hypothetical protein